MHSISQFKLFRESLIPIMSEERSTPAPIENLRHEAQSRPFTSFYISDILGESPDRTRQLVSGERTPLEENGTAEGINEPNLIGTARIIYFVFLSYGVKYTQILQ